MVTGNTLISLGVGVGTVQLWAAIVPPIHEQADLATRRKAMAVASILAIGGALVLAADMDAYAPVIVATVTLLGMVGLYERF